MARPPRSRRPGASTKPSSKPGLRTGTPASFRGDVKTVPVRTAIKPSGPPPASKVPGTKPTTATPTKVGTPEAPAGMYDPNLDAQLRAAGRGLGDLTADIGTNRTRASSDFLLGQGATERSRTQQTQDFNSAIQGIQRNYATLANTQGERQRQGGVLYGGGAIAQAARKRAANQTLEEAPVKTSFARAIQNLDLGQGQANLAFQRQGDDWTTQLGRARRENTFFAQDIQQAKNFQATQANWDPNAATTPATTPATKPAGKPATTRKKRLKSGVTRTTRTDYQGRGARFNG